MTIIDCAQMMEPHWLWGSYPFVSQTYDEGDEFQEFGLKWHGVGFTHVTAPGWRIPGARRLDDYPLETFVGVATVVDVREARELTASELATALGDKPPRRLLILKTGHADRLSNRRLGYWRKAPRIDPGIAALLRERNVAHVCIDLPCDDVPARRASGEGAFHNPNGAFRRALHEAELVLTENCVNLSALRESEVFFASLPIAAPDLTTSPCRPVALTHWRHDQPTAHDLSTPLFNHWRWKVDIWKAKSFEAGDEADETHVVYGAHGFTHCDAPKHMYREGLTIHELPNRGLDLFIREAVVADFSDLDLPAPITRDLMAARAGHVRKGDFVLLRSDLTNRLGYEHREWHLYAPNVEEEAALWLANREPAAVGLDFPQDFVAREMPKRRVRNSEFVAHHAMFRRGIPYVEDIRDIGSLESERPLVLAVPLKMTCIDGAPMRVVALEW